MTAPESVNRAVAALETLVGNHISLLDDQASKAVLAGLALARFSALLVLEEPRTGKMIERRVAKGKTDDFDDAVKALHNLAPDIVPFLFASMMMRVDADKLRTLVDTQGPKGEKAKYIRIYPGLNTTEQTGQKTFTLIFAAEGAVSGDIITPSAMANRPPGVADGDEVLEDIDPCRPPRCPKL